MGERRGAVGGFDVRLRRAAVADDVEPVLLVVFDAGDDVAVQLAVAAGVARPWSSNLPRLLMNIRPASPRNSTPLSTLCG